MIPQVDFFGTQVTRLIVGDNPFSGHSYIPDIANGNEMMDYYTRRRLLRRCLRPRRRDTTPIFSGLSLHPARDSPIPQRGRYDEVDLPALSPH